MIRLRHLTIILLILLIGCKSTGLLNQFDQPHQNKVAPPVGKWTRTPTICVDDSVVYTSAGCTPNPALQPICAGITEPAAREFVNYIHAIHAPVDARFISNIEYADIPVRLYDGPYGGVSALVDKSSTPVDKSSTTIDDEWLKWILLLSIAYTIYVNTDGEYREAVVAMNLTGQPEGTEAAVMNVLNRNPPPADVGYNGVCYYTRRGDRLTATSVWINVNVAGWSGCTRDTLEVYIANITRHELGHAVVGLNDNTSQDNTPDEPGLMSYTGHQPYVDERGVWLMSAEEIDVVRWMYQ
jgi:hypothetical protein